MLRNHGDVDAGPGPLFYVLCSEIFPDFVRGRAMSLINAIQWSFNLLLSLFFVSVMESIGGGMSTFCFWKKITPGIFPAKGQP